LSSQFDAKLSERINAMRNPIRIDQNEEEILNYEVSDEAMETAAGASRDKAVATAAFCSGLDTCPA
jgi:hypothetical protein